MLNLLRKLMSSNKAFQTKRTLRKVNRIILRPTHKLAQLPLTLKNPKNVIPFPKIRFEINRIFLPFLFLLLRNYGNLTLFVVEDHFKKMVLHR